MKQETKDIAHNSAPMTPTSRASSSRNLSAVSTYQLCHAGLREQVIMGQSHTWICACTRGKQLPTVPSSLGQTAVMEAAVRPLCLEGTQGLHEPGQDWRELRHRWHCSLSFCVMKHVVCVGDLLLGKKHRLPSN